MEGRNLVTFADEAEVLHVTVRRRLPFRAVNRPDMPGYRKDMQRHHLLPRQVLRAKCFNAMFTAIGCERIGFEDFRANGLLLPASADAVLATGLPLHRGPHRIYNDLVAERVGQMEAHWRGASIRTPTLAREDTLLRIDLLQRALRRRLMQGEKRGFTLNRFDPFRAGVDFTELDAMADVLWSASADD
ncbi:hypothetical protein CP97_10565 [Aurantiacibacter atlanticus]|uniref:Uncharacterized protein n=1 Tax=Aurantiacibacter atlanticus TaxID=1648404 RepID=A0A0H4VG57_9SPHN|nr:hypothetical protein CP97_10565 [Aurantiacibacter atlanticus]